MVAGAAAILALGTSSAAAQDRLGVGVGVGVGGARATVVAAQPPQECAVCLSELAGPAGCCEPESSAADYVRTLPGCGHGFHAECIGRWLPLRAQCPLCRLPVPPEVAADRQPATLPADAAPAWSRPAKMACGFGDGRVVWTRSPSAQEL
ncbi:hypothetical protein ABZP36_019988 [Zizania latifolia]